MDLTGFELPFEWIALVAVAMGLAAAMQLRRPAAKPAPVAAAAPRASVARPPRGPVRVRTAPSFEGVVDLLVSVGARARRGVERLASAWRVSESVEVTQTERSATQSVQAATVAALPVRIDLSRQFALLESRVRGWVDGVGRVETLQASACRQFDAVDYALIKLRDELGAVLPEAVAGQHHLTGRSEAMPSRVAGRRRAASSRAGRGSRAAVRTRRTRSVAAA